MTSITSASLSGVFLHDISLVNGENETVPPRLKTNNHMEGSTINTATFSYKSIIYYKSKYRSLGRIWRK